MGSPCALERVEVPRCEMKDGCFLVGWTGLLRLVVAVAMLKNRLHWYVIWIMKRDLLFCPVKKLS